MNFFVPPGVATVTPFSVPPSFLQIGHRINRTLTLFPLDCFVLYDVLGGGIGSPDGNKVFVYISLDHVDSLDDKYSYRGYIIAGFGI